ncbi:MAG: hypothetical protein QW764_01270 [Desulfurococcaceae archaeon]
MYLEGLRQISRTVVNPEIAPVERVTPHLRDLKEPVRGSMGGEESLLNSSS